MIPICLLGDPEDFHLAIMLPRSALINGAVLCLLFGAQSAPGRFLLGPVDNHPFGRISLKPGVFPQVTARGKGEPLCVSHRFVVFAAGAGAA